jgi:hypothetical protein
MASDDVDELQMNLFGDVKEQPQLWQVSNLSQLAAVRGTHAAMLSIGETHCMTALELLVVAIEQMARMAAVSLCMSGLTAVHNAELKLQLLHHDGILKTTGNNHHSL